MNINKRLVVSMDDKKKIIKKSPDEKIEKKKNI